MHSESSVKPIPVEQSLVNQAINKLASASQLEGRNRKRSIHEKQEWHEKQAGWVYTD